VDLRKALKVLTRTREHTLGITRKVGCHRAVQPKRSEFLASHSLSVTHESLHVIAEHASMDGRPLAIEFAALTQIDDVLTGAAQQLGSLSGRQEVMVRADFHG
jgi:hypothetical protein